MLCGLGGVGVARQRERLTALGILKFCSNRISRCMFQRGVLLSFVKVLTNTIFKVLLRQCIVAAIRMSTIVFKEGVGPVDFICDKVVAFKFSVFMGVIVRFGLGGVGVMRSLGDIRWGGRVVELPTCEGFACFPMYERFYGRCPRELK